MKAYLIDPETRTIAEITIDPAAGLRDYYAAIGCSLVTVAALDTLPGHDLWLDDEGLFAENGPAGFIYAPECGQELFAGRAIVTGGVDDEGDTTGATCTARDIQRRLFAVTDLLPGGVTVCAPLTIAAHDSPAADNQGHAGECRA